MSEEERWKVGKRKRVRRGGERGGGRSEGRWRERRYGVRG